MSKEEDFLQSKPELYNHYYTVIQYLKEYVDILVEKKITEMKKKSSNNGKDQ
ncbi:MAG TPA: hypothetical protein VK179_19475 [Bacteroidales bacterium]|nr:hypothetical protein [Bacteroidales bacterium]